MVLFAWMFLLAAPLAFPHAAPVPAPKPPFRVQGALLLDADRAPFLLSGALLPGLAFEGGTEDQDAAIAALRPLTFRILRQRWNLNAVRMPVRVRLFSHYGPEYLHRIAAAVEMAAAEDLVVQLAVEGEAPLPGPGTVAFLAALGTRLRDQPRVVFSLPAGPFEGEGDRRAAWQAWRVAMQAAIDALRSTGAGQIISVGAFDSEGFRGYEKDLRLLDRNLMYEARDVGLGSTDADRDRRFGFLAGEAPVWVTWAVSDTDEDLTAGVYQMLAYTLLRSLSWTVSSFEPGDLIEDYDGMIASETRGRLILLWQTGDPYGFGSIAADQIASAAGGPAAPVAPGQVVNIYGQLVGPETEVAGVADESGKVPGLVAETQILFGGVAVPVLSTSYFFVKVQVPYEVAGLDRVTVQAIYRGVASNTVTLALTDAAPGLFTRFGSIADVAATNGNQTQNSSNAPAGVGTVVTLLATGLGELIPAGVTGRPAAPPLGKPSKTVTATVGGLAAEVLTVEEAAGTVGMIELRLRIPAVAGSGIRGVPVVLSVMGKRSLPDARIWIQ